MLVGTHVASLAGGIREGGGAAARDRRPDVDQHGLLVALPGIRAQGPPCSGRRGPRVRSARVELLPDELGGRGRGGPGGHPPRAPVLRAVSVLPRPRGHRHVPGVEARAAGLPARLLPGTRRPRGAARRPPPDPERGDRRVDRARLRHQRRGAHLRRRRHAVLPSLHGCRACRPARPPRRRPRS